MLRLLSRECSVQPRKADRMEQQPAEFYERVRNGYRELAAHEPKRIVLINGSDGVDEIEKVIWRTLRSRFSELTNASDS